MCRWVLSCVLTVPAKHSWHQILRQSASSHILGVGKNIPGIYVPSRDSLTLHLSYHIHCCIASSLKRKFFTMYFIKADMFYCDIAVSLYVTLDGVVAAADSNLFVYEPSIIKSCFFIFAYASPR